MLEHPIKRKGLMEKDETVDLKFLPFPVHPSQRVILQQYRTKAVAKEAELVSRKKQQFEQLKMQILERANANVCTVKKRKPKVNRSSRNSSSGGGGGGTSEPVTADTTKISTGGAVKVDVVVHRMSHRTPESLLGGMVKGFLTRKLFHSNKVQLIVRTIKDALGVLDTLQNPSNRQDEEFKGRMETQLSVARMTLHEIFFQLPPAERMTYISHSRTLKQLKRHTLPPPQTTANSPHQTTSTVASNEKVGGGGRGGGGGGGGQRRRPNIDKNTRASAGGKLSAATLKSIERRMKANQTTSQSTRTLA